MYTIMGKEYKFRKNYSQLIIYSNEEIDISEDGLNIGGDRVFDPIIVQVGDVILETWSSEWGAIKILSSGGIN